MFGGVLLPVWLSIINKIQLSKHTNTAELKDNVSIYIQNKLFKNNHKYIIIAHIIPKSFYLFYSL